MLTIPEAVSFAKNEFNQQIPVRTLRYACAEGLLEGAVKRGRDWQFPKSKFLHWIEFRPKPGRKVSEQSENFTENK